ncbi:hypothetical protein N7539_007499 [Penicillium diatomitis]|uniref:PXA domain-containing protein n=1 Tax=Penicillium diatomitis TaxID=2819901 RepID=A0A9W9WVL1_9EURO|nr:uncharacterized protein N7539_007499 [Penicillium diatomitis]KAJ5477355.1 hypothetical protein N7539_007499 [Penicillium diatomitis]
MKDPLRPGLQPVSQLKTGPTTSSTQSSTLLSPASPLVRSSPQLRVQRLSSREDTQDSVKEKSTGDLIRRVLYPQTSSGHGASSPQPAEEVLPPLTSSNEVDHQLYAILAVIIRDFVYTWYSKITSDQALVNEVLQVIAHCTRALEQRIRQVDVTQLFLDEIPALVEFHIRSYRLSKEGSSLSGLPTSRRALYHELNPHPGLLPIPDPTDPDTVTAQAENEAVYRRLLANGTLAVLLPTEDLGNSSLRYLVGDIVSDLILGKQIGARVCQGWFLWEIIGKAADAGQRREASKGSNSPTDVGASQLDKFGLLHDEDAPAKTDDNRQSRTAVWLWSILQNIYLVYLGLRFVVTGLFQVASGSKKAASRDGSVSIPAATSYVSHAEGLHTWSSEGATTKIPVLDYRLYSMLSQVLCIPSRLPWLSGILALARHMTLAGPGRIGKSDGILDR